MYPIVHDVCTTLLCVRLRLMLPCIDWLGCPLLRTWALSFALQKTCHSGLGPFPLLCEKRVTPSPVFMEGNPHFHARRRATLAIPIRHRDNLIAKEGRLYNTEPNLVVYF